MPDPATGRITLSTTTRSPTRWLVCAVMVLFGVCVLSIVVGSAWFPPSTVWAALHAPDGSIDQQTITEVRVPRTVLGVVVGAALGVAGALMQGLTRNPLADPGILGVNAGAGFAIAIGVAAAGLVDISDYIWLAFVGAVGAAFVVYALAARGVGGATPIRLTLVGVALTAVLMGMTRALALMNPQNFDRMRFWQVGSITDRPGGTLTVIIPFVGVGLIIALGLSRGLNALALGDEAARAIGSRVGWTRAAGMAAIVLLCGASTAAAGPIAFVGLMIPHAVRMLTGTDQRWTIAFSMVLAPVLLLTSDIAGRLIVWPAELTVGVMTALFGAPVLIVLVRRGQLR